MLAYTWFELIRTMRNFRFLIFAIGMPVMFYLLFNSIFGGAQIQGTAYNSYILVSMAAYSAIGSAMYAGSSLPAERASGWIRQLRITPLSTFAWLRAKVIQAFLVVLPGQIAIAFCAVLQGHVQLDAGQWAGLAGVVVVGAVPFILLGLFIGQLFDSQVSQPAQGAVLMAMSFAGGLFFPLSSFPSAVRAGGQVLPSHEMLELGREIVVRQQLSMDVVAGLAVWTVVLALAVLLAWRRESAGAVAAA